VRVGELSGELQTLNKCCNANDWWVYCDLEGHSECFATKCEVCFGITYRDCKGDL